MGQLAMAMLAAFLLQAPTPTAAQGAQGEKPSATQQSNQVSTQSKPATTTPESQDAVEKRVEEKLREALGKGQTELRDGNPNLSPETEKAIETAVEKFLADPVIKSSIAEKIHQVTMPGQSVMISAMFVPIALFALIGLLVWLHYRSNQAKMQAQMQAQAQLLGKFDSGSELAAFLGSPGGQQLLGGLTAPHMNPRSRVLKHVGIGAVAATLGLGMLFFGRGITFPGVVFLSIGVGFLVSAAASYNLSKKMGLLNGDAKGPTGGTAPQV